MPKRKVAEDSAEPKPETVVHGYKGFNKDLKCIDMQYIVGQEHAMPQGKKLVCCPDNPAKQGGLHFCENPLDVLGYYPPAGDDGIPNRFAEVEGRGDVAGKDGDTKKACSRLYIKAEITLSHLIGAGVKFILDRVNWDSAKESATGYQSAATNTGYQSAATNTGYQSAATNTGNQSAAIVEGKESIAIATGFEGKAKGKKGCWIVLAEWKEKSDGYHIIDVKSFPVDGETVKEDTFYRLEEGTAIEVQ